MGGIENLERLVGDFMIPKEDASESLCSPLGSIRMPIVNYRSCRLAILRWK